jgi:hypothetical protein
MLKFKFVHIASCNLSQNFDVNHESWSDTMETSTPCSLTSSSTYISGSLSMESEILMGRKWTLFVSLSTIAHMPSCLLGALGRPATKFSCLVPFSHWHFERLMLPSWPLVFSFHKLTRRALSNILNDITPHATPPKLFIFYFLFYFLFFFRSWYILLLPG